MMNSKWMGLCGFGYYRDQYDNLRFSSFKNYGDTGIFPSTFIVSITRTDIGIASMLKEMLVIEMLGVK